MDSAIRMLVLARIKAQAAFTQEDVLIDALNGDVRYFDNPRYVPVLVAVGHTLGTFVRQGQLREERTGYGFSVYYVN